MSRLIDADALIHELNNSHYPGAPYIDAGISIAIGKVCDAPTIEPEPQWIPCSERLPEYGKTVLWCNDKGSIFTTAITYMNGTSWAVGKRHRRCQVVAWMPLPEPYKEGEQNED